MLKDLLHDSGHFLMARLCSATVSLVTAANIPHYLLGLNENVRRGDILLTV